MSYGCQVWSKHCCKQLKYWSGLFDSLQFISIHIVWIGICSNRPLAPLSVRGHKFDFWLLDRKFNGSKPVQRWINTESFCLFTHCLLHCFWVGTRMITNKTTIQLQCILSFDNILTTPFKIPAYLCPAFSPPVPSANARSLKRWSLAIATQANVWPFGRPGNYDVMRPKATLGKVILCIVHVGTMGTCTAFKVFLFLPG